MSHPTYSLDDLAERSDTPARTIRYYIQRGLVSRPVGEKRGAHYTAEHLQQLLQIRKWVGAGLSLQRIGELMQGASPAAYESTTDHPEASKPSLTLKHHHPVAPGIELVIDPAQRHLTPAQAEGLLALIREHLGRLDHTA